MLVSVQFFWPVQLFNLWNPEVIAFLVRIKKQNGGF